MPLLYYCSKTFLYSHKGFHIESFFYVILDKTQHLELHIIYSEFRDRDLVIAPPTSFFIWLQTLSFHFDSFLFVLLESFSCVEANTIKPPSSRVECFPFYFYNMLYLKKNYFQVTAFITCLLHLQVSYPGRAVTQHGLTWIRKFIGN